MSEKYLKIVELKLKLTNLHIVNFLGITLDLCNNTFGPYRKSDNRPVYTNKNSNHSKTILRELHKSISKDYLTCHLTNRPFKWRHQYILKHWRKVNLMNLEFSYQRQIPATIPVKNNGNAKKNILIRHF